MSAITLTKLYDLLTSKVGKETAENLTTFIEQKIITDLENKSQILATKGDISVLKEDISVLNLKIEQIKSELELKMTQIKVDLLKWIFAFWISLVFMFLGIYLK